MLDVMGGGKGGQFSKSLIINFKSELTGLIKLTDHRQQP